MDTEATLDEFLQDIPEPVNSGATATKVQFGKVFQPQQQILLYSADEWEEFIREWVHSQKKSYINVLRFGGAGDMGIDVAGLADENGLKGVWDNFQCKHYANSLTPATAALEVGKVLWHSFNKRYSSPRAYYFVAPKGCGRTLTQMLEEPSEIQKYVVGNWDSCCAGKITSTTKISLIGEFLAYVNKFDYSIFRSTNILEIIDQHRQTSYFPSRFGGGLSDRPAVESPPEVPAENESRYIEQLFEAYSDHAKQEFSSLEEMGTRTDLVEHFHRHREFFYNAEALRNFSRDTVPPGTFEELQSEVHAGVIDVEASEHADGFVRLNTVTLAATQLHMTSNALMSVVKVQDKKGICHQLANVDRLRWRKP
jgi:hypothetical protein